jgi:hypothetical protein
MLTIRTGPSSQPWPEVDTHLGARCPKVFVDQLYWTLPVIEDGLERSQLDQLQLFGGKPVGHDLDQVQPTRVSRARNFYRQIPVSVGHARHTKSPPHTADAGSVATMYEGRPSSPLTGLRPLRVPCAGGFCRQILVSVGHTRHTNHRRIRLMLDQPRRCTKAARLPP